MGLHIFGVQIPRRHLKRITNPDYRRTFCLKGFERSLLPNEQTIHDWNQDPCSRASLDTAYGYYGEMRAEMARIFLQTTITQVWQDCRRRPRTQIHYSRRLHLLLNFADNEGYIGPQAVKKLAKYLNHPGRVHKALQQVSDPTMKAHLRDLIRCIRETARLRRGYLCFA